MSPSTQSAEGSGRSDARQSVWTTRGPRVWPAPPTRMSYTSLQNIETCPLRWGLRRGEYPDIWPGRGYPPSPAGATIAGHVVHVALERIVGALGAKREAQANGDRSAARNDPMALVVGTLRALGGISAVLEDVIRETVDGWEANPRMKPRAREFASDVQRQTPALRARVQYFLNLIDLSQVRPARSGAGVAPTPAAEQSLVKELRPGLYAEVPLVNDDLGWYGKADLLRVSAAGDPSSDSEIIDFKTGAPKSDHALQLRVYALLWARDRRQNPTGRPVQRLTVLYPSGPVEVSAPTTDEELEAIAQEVSARTAKAREAVERHPPEASPSREACEWCDVRHMCPPYWTAATRALITSLPERARSQVDVSVQVLGKQGAWSWTARVHELGALSSDLSVGESVLLRARLRDDHFASLFSTGRRFRILSGRFVAESDESGGFPVLSLTRSTEAFASDEPGGSLP
jgi:hypothetical protein